MFGFTITYAIVNAEHVILKLNDIPCSFTSFWSEVENTTVKTKRCREYTVPTFYSRRERRKSQQR